MGIISASTRAALPAAPERLIAEALRFGDADGERAVQVEGLKVGPHKPEPNYLHDVVMTLLRPVQAFTPESVIYRIDSDRR
jgi:hypothetical protein